MGFMTAVGNERIYASQSREQEVSCLPECCQRAQFSSGWIPGMGLTLKRPSHSIHTDSLLLCTEREVGGVLLICLKKHCRGSCPGHRLGHCWSSEWRETGLHPCLFVLAQRVNVLPMAADFFGASFHSFSPFSVGLTARFAHICAVGINYRPGRRFLRGQELGHSSRGDLALKNPFSGQALYH